MTSKLLVVDALQILKQKAREVRKEAKTNSKLVIQGLKTHLFPPTLLQIQNIYSCQSLFNPCDSKINKFVLHINKTVEYLEHLPRFGMYQ